MKVIECSDLREEDGTISLANRIKGTLNFGLNWYDEMQAQEEICARLSKTLKRDHIMIRNAIIPGTKLPVPMMLLSPQGVRVIVPNRVRGSYRAKGDEWQKFDPRGRKFRRARPNPMDDVRLMADVLLRSIQDRGYGLPGIESVLLFTDVNAHIDQLNPGVRIVQADAIDHFAVNLLKIEPIMDQDDIRAISDAILHPKESETDEVAEPENELAPGLINELPPFTTEEEQPLAAEELPPFKFPDTDPMDYPMFDPNAPDAPPLGAPFYARWGFSRNQFVLLAVMAFIELLIITVMAVMVLADIAF
ncbi:MAG: hypothetical protein P8Z42_01920 [Anaerolineales bacterium]|jgi:hypothetical protein